MTKRHHRVRRFVGMVCLPAALMLSLETTASAATIGLTDQPINTVVALKDDQCLVHFEFGSIYGAAYAKIRLINPGTDWCLVRSQIVGVRGTRLVNGPWTAWSLLGGPGAGLHAMGTDWMQSTASYADGLGAHYEISVQQGRTVRVDTINVSAF